MSIVPPGPDRGVGRAAILLLSLAVLLLEVAYTRIFSTAKSQAADTYIAGGALDQYFIGNAGLSAIF